VIVVSRFRVAEDEGDGFGEEARSALTAFGARPGYFGGRVGRNVDDPTLWVLTTWWHNTGSYRRALSSYDVKVTVLPLQPHAIDEPSAYEDLTSEEFTVNEALPRNLH
jgi:hypothetical protein